MVQRDEAVGFAAAKAGFGLDDRISAVAAEASHCRDQQVTEAGGRMGAAEKFRGVAVLGDGAGAVINGL